MQVFKSRIRFAALFTVLIFAGCTTNPYLKSGEGYIQVEGGKVWYGIMGEGENTPLLVMHGGPGSTSRSFYQYSSIAEDRPIIMFDQLGSGRSDYHEDTSLLKVENFVAQIEALRKELGLKDFYVLGHSWGTALGLEYYLAHPEGIKGLVFSSPYFSTAIWDADADTLISTLPDSIQFAIQIGEENGDFMSAEYLKADEVFAKNFGLRKTRLSSELDTVPSESNSFIYNYMWGPTEFTATGTLKNYDRLTELKEVKVPTLFMTGEFDEARPTSVRYFQSLVPNSKFMMIEGAGHATMHDNNDQTVESIRSFLNSLNDNP
ncbi:MAG: proline iminopeptidase-family hydrolase [Algoriphagus sp.]|nr:proline iminopeptidase-family hydrolase [Algoriphagus sp.]